MRDAEAALRTRNAKVLLKQFAREKLSLGKNILQILDMEYNAKFLRDGRITYWSHNEYVELRIYYK